ncbi:MAG: M20 family metallopeptidase [Bacteroidota bacterium]|nr:M20 family metallopeptidase [Bacteroidota bacterium]
MISIFLRLTDTVHYIKELSASYFKDVQAIRRHLHAHPELSFQEKETQAFVSAELTKLGIPHQNIGGTGLVAHIEGQNPKSRSIALRSDLDALPITEKNDVPYKSKHEGVMHACGHDVHTSCLLGAARIFTTLKDRFEGTFRLIFQPGEEKLPGGASLLIKEGVLEDPVPEAIIGQHVMPEMETGKAGFRSGLYMASADEIYITVKGKGGHGAMPHLIIDPVVIASHLIIALQQVASRWSKPSIPTVLSFGKLEAKGATNVIPDEVKIEGTFRTFDEDWRSKAHTKMKELAQSVVTGMGGRIEFDIRVGYPFLKNDEVLTSRLAKAARTFLGENNIENLDLRATAEDFAFYSHHVPACFYRLGTGNTEKKITSSVHNPHFDIDEDALETGMGLMTWLGLEAIKR